MAATTLGMARRQGPLNYPYATDLNIPKPAWSQEPSAQFPAKYSQLPSIPSPTPAVDNQVVPFHGAGGRNGMRSSVDLIEAQEKVNFLESRLGVTEKSNRALLEEVLRLQNELRTSVNKNENTLREERNARQQVESSLKMCNDLIMQLSTRIKVTEEKLLEERSALSTLVTHTKGVEQAVLSSQHELRTKKDSQMTRISELQGSLHETQRAKDQVEKQVFSLMEELRGLRSKVDTQNQEFQSIASDLRMRSKRLEEENRVQRLESMRKQGDIQTQTNSSTTHLRGQVETRMGEIRDVILDLRTRQDQESTDRRSLEQTLQLRSNELKQLISEQNRKREESMHALDMIAREKEHKTESDRMKQQAKVAETLEDINKKILNKEIKLREEIQDKHVQLEKLMQKEQSARNEYERRSREEVEAQYQNMKKMTDSEIQALRDLIKNDRSKGKETLLKLNDAITLLEKQMQENKKQVDKILSAEIKSRKEREKKTDDKLDNLQEKLAVATMTLQQAIGGVTSQLSDHTDKVRTEVKDLLKEQDQSSARAMTDMDARLQNMNKKVSGIEGDVNSKVNKLALLSNPERQEHGEAATTMGENLREKVASITLWQDVTSQTIRELNASLQAMPNDIDAVEEKQRLMKSDLTTRLQMETDHRLRDVDNLKDEIQLLKNKKPTTKGVSSAELETDHKILARIQQSVRKLAESIQTVKTVLGMKIQSEQKLRMSGLEELQSQISEIKTVLANNPSIRWHPEIEHSRSTVQSVPGFDVLMKTDLEEEITGKSWALTQQHVDEEDEDVTKPNTNSERSHVISRVHSDAAGQTNSLGSRNNSVLHAYLNKSDVEDGDKDDADTTRGAPGGPQGEDGGTGGTDDWGGTEDRAGSQMAQDGPGEKTRAPSAASQTGSFTNNRNPSRRPSEGHARTPKSRRNSGQGGDDEGSRQQAAGGSSRQRRDSLQDI
ncbi:paramyosin-like isoform X4 [Haliotis rufescens]|uniref:paramyosin-like isoform X4 n=1 Tax=Haliotis rufescens TaxID=6454 RepID=UPI00201EB4EC|nr:paramyosin-like isoform X4 [Haliotis rufescens]